VAVGRIADCRFRIADSCRCFRRCRPSLVRKFQAEIRKCDEPHKHHRAADFRRNSGIFLTFGPTTTQKFKTGVYQMLAPFFTGGSGFKKQLTSVRTGLKSLDQLEHENANLQVENRELRATNQGLRDAENEVNRLRHALNYRERSVLS